MRLFVPRGIPINQVVEVLSTARDVVKSFLGTDDLPVNLWSTDDLKIAIQIPWDSPDSPSFAT